VTFRFTLNTLVICIIYIVGKTGCYTLQNMKIIRKFSPNKKDLKESVAQLELMRDFPPISKEDNPEVLAELIAAYVKESGGIILDRDTPDIPDDAPLRVRAKRTKEDDDSKAAVAQAKKQKKAKSEATNYDSVSAPTPKRKRGRGESSVTKEAANLALEEWDAEAEEPRPKKMQLTSTEIVSPMFVMTPEMTKRVDEHAKKLLEEKKKKKEQYLAEREEKLKSLRLDSCDEFFVQKLAEVREIAGTVEQEAMKEAQKMLENIQATSKVSASEAVPESAAPESATKVEKSEASGNPSDLKSAKIIQISDSPTIISPSLSPTNDSDHDDMPLGQRINMLPKPSQKPSQTTQQTPLQEGQSSAAAEGSKDSEEPNTTDLPHCDSPSNLFSLERHLGGELMETPQKATKSVPKKIDLVNQQPPKPTQQNNPEPSSIQSITQTHTQTQEMTIPESVIETMVKESVLVTESEPSVSIPDSEPTQNLLLTTTDKPSSSSNIQILEQPPINLLESEFIETELLKISKDMQDLVHFKKVPTLSIDYEDQWASLKNRTSELLEAVSQKCIRIQAAEVKRHLRALHLAAKAKAPILYLANAPFYPESDYLSREAKVLKMLKQKVLQQQAESKAKEDILLQRHLALEETVKQQAEVIKKQVEDFAKLVALLKQQQNKETNP